MQSMWVFFCTWLLQNQGRAHRCAMRNLRSAKVTSTWWLQNQEDRGAQHRAIVNSQLV
tara:strand:+ start:368 stop:541 length:174 start_codon:yes stop_codon:yes gene_type:complete